VVDRSFDWRGGRVRVRWAGVCDQDGGVDVGGDQDVGLYGWCRDLDGSASRRWLRSWL
jgi:hypothetical protein